MAFKTKHFRLSSLAAVALAGVSVLGSAISAQAAALSCPVTQAQLKSALTQADTADTTGFNNHFWGVVVNRAGVVCAVAYSGATTGSQWLGSRQIAAAKAFTANAFSLDLPGFGGGMGALSTGELYQFVQPSNAVGRQPAITGSNGGNVLDSTIAYQGSLRQLRNGERPDDRLPRRRHDHLRRRPRRSTSGQKTDRRRPRSLRRHGLRRPLDRLAHPHQLLGLPSDGSDALTFATNANMTDGPPALPERYVATQGTTNPCTMAAAK